MKISIYYQNVNGLKTKIDEFRMAIINVKFDVIVMCETWLKENIFDEELFDNRYILYRKDRDPNLVPNKSDGGGCLIAIKSNYYSARIYEWELLQEDIWVSLEQSNGEKIFINVRYIPVNSTLNVYNEHQHKVSDILNVLKPDQQYLLLGDYNLKNSISWTVDDDGVCRANDVNGTIADNFVDFLSLTNLNQFSSVTNKNNRTLDLVLSNIDPSNITVNEELDPIVKVDWHHPPLTIEVDTAPLDYLIEDRLPKPNFFRADYVALNDKISSIDWAGELDPLSVDDATQRFYDLLMKLLLHIPKVSKNKGEFPCWFTDVLIRLIKKKSNVRHELQKMSKKIPLCVHAVDELKKTFSYLRKEVKSLTEVCRGRYVNDIETKLAVNSKCFFLYTKSLKTSNSVPKSIEHGNVRTNDRQSVCNLFADYFRSVYQKPDRNQLQRILLAPVFTMPVIQPSEIKVILDKLDKYKASSPDGIPAIFYKSLSASICIPLAILYNKSIDEDKFPALWKESFLMPIYKSGSKLKAANYRPISIICAASKVFERLIFNRLYAHIKQFISKRQHGFVSGRSTQTNLLVYLTDIVDSISNGGQVDTIYTDFSKAFDRVSHNLLLQELNVYGIFGGVNHWFDSYLTNRSQYVVIGSTKSNRITPTSGIPQGSVLGPLLFLIFVNRLPDKFKHSNSLLLADDLKLYKKIGGTSDCSALQEDIDSLMDWCGTYKLDHNVKKCFSFSTTFSPNKVNCVYKMNGEILESCDVKDDLGVVFDSKVSFKLHNDKIVRKAYQMLGFIFRSTKSFNDPKSLILLYNAYVRSRLEYCSSLWNPIYSKYIDSIEKVQRKFTRLLYRKFNWIKPDYCTRLLQLKMHSLESRRIEMDEILLYKIINGNIDSTLRSHIHFNNPQRFTRNQSIFYLPNLTTNYTSNSPMYRLQSAHDKYFSSLNLHETSISKFKRQVKDHFPF